MSKRRPAGDGLVRKRADGRWEGRIVVGHKEDGSPIFRSVFARTQKEVMRKLHNQIETYRDVELTEESNMTLGEWLDKWLSDYMALTIRESTMDGYKIMTQHYIKPYLGDEKIGSITTADIQKLYNWLRENGRVNEHYEKGNALSDSMIRSIHMMLHQAMDAAVRERIIVKNPTEGTVIPKNNYAPKQILTEEQLERFLDVVRQDPVWSDFFYTELTTGMRLGEICGLKWQDFEEKTGRLHIRRSVHRRKGGGVRVGETKTETGTRTILLPPSTVEILKARKKKSYSDWIFHNPVVAEVPMDPSIAYHRLKTLLRHAELPSIRFHDLRHTFATHALTSGVDAKTLSTILGHTNASFTLDTYTHMTTDMHQKAATVVGGFLDEIM
ncbi:MAG: site-specific integrase [Oscillospiraceae bacterium]|nr:site-specific integrase [Oscillospiraceae bacterium]